MYTDRGQHSHGLEVRALKRLLSIDEDQIRRRPLKFAQDKVARKFWGIQLHPGAPFPEAA